MSTEATTVLLKKRERTQNWIPEEKNALFALIKLHVNAIENKKIDQAASTMKALAWQQIYSSFRGKFSADRDIVRIREQWRRMKAQARIEMHTYAEKVRTLGPEVAAKSRPSNLSIEVWRLMESVRRNDCDADRSDDSSSQDTHENSTANTTSVILDNLTSLAAQETSAAGHEIKIEINSDTYHSEDESSHGELARKLSDDFSPKKRPKMAAGSAGSVEQKVACADSSATSRAHVDAAERSAGNELPFVHDDQRSDKNQAMRQRATWIYKSTHREHEIKLRTLQIELERAELQKQTAVNELKTSEIKRQLIESQAAEYYSQVRMAGERGSGAGKGGGGGGTIREAGGSFGKMEAAHEDQYFYNLQKEQLQKMRESLHDEISFHEEQIKRHQEAISRHKKRITDMDQKE